MMIYSYIISFYVMIWLSLIHGVISCYMWEYQNIILCDKTHDSVDDNVSCMYIYQSLRTPLHEAAFNGHTDVMKVLLAAGANIEAKDEVSARVCMSI